MRAPRRDSGALLAAAVLAAVAAAAACAGGGGADPGAPRDVPMMRAGDLQLAIPEDAILARIDGVTVVTAGEYNDRLGEFLVENRGQTVLEARRQVLGRLLDHKLIAHEAARQRAEAGLPPLTDGHPYQIERSLAMSLIREQVASPQAVTEDEAAQFAREHPDRFHHLESTALSQEERVLFVKFSLLSDRFQERVRRLRARSDIVVDEGLLAGAGEAEGRS